MRDDYVEIGEAGGDRFAGVFPVGDFGDFFWGVVAEESPKKNFFSIGEPFADGVLEIEVEAIEIPLLSGLKKLGIVWWRVENHTGLILKGSTYT